MKGFSSQAFVLAAAAGLAASQSLSGLGLSKQCQDTLTNAIGNPDLSKCLNIFNAINIFTTTNSSIVQPVDNWLEGVCAASPCSNDTITQAAQNITTGCAADLSSIGIGSDEASSIQSTVQQIYPTVRKVACLSDSKSSNHSLCVTELLTDLQSSIGTLSLNNLVSIVQSFMNGTSTGISIPKNVTCNDCTQAAWAIIKQDQPSVTSDATITDPISSQCGTDFLNGSQPSDIVESTGGAATTGAALGGQISLGNFAGLAIASLISAIAGATLLL